jgi:hypothetical protein
MQQDSPLFSYELKDVDKVEHKGQGVSACPAGS